MGEVPTGLQIREFLHELFSSTKANCKSLGVTIALDQQPCCLATATLALIRRPNAGFLPKREEGTARVSHSLVWATEPAWKPGAAKWGGGEGTLVLYEGKQGLYPEKLV